MAEGTGVTGEHRSAHPPATGGGGSWFKKHRALVLGGGGIAAVLMLSHKGSTAGQTPGGSPQDQLQAQSDALAAQEAGLESGGVLPPGGSAPTTVDTGGGTYAPAAPTASATAPPVGPIDVTVNNPPAGPGGNPKPGGGGGHGGGGHGGGGHGGGHGHPHPGQPPHPPGGHGSGHPGGGKGKGGHKPPAKGKPKTVQNPHAPHSGGHGTTVHGRTFPGATGHTLGRPQRKSNGEVHQPVKVHYGGHTDTHTSINAGQAWADHTTGHSPPSRQGSGRHPAHPVHA